MITEWNSITETTINHLDAANADMSFSRPPPQSDLLAVPVGKLQRGEFNFNPQWILYIVPKK